MVRSECRHTEIKATGGGREEFAVLKVVGRGRMLWLVFVLVTAGGRRGPVGGRRPRVRGILVVGWCAAVAPGELEWLALDVVLHRAVLVVEPVALDLVRQVIVLDHGEVRWRGVVVVERRRAAPGPFHVILVQIRRASLVPPYLCPA